MTRTKDEDGQPNLSNKKMLQILLKEIPLLYGELRTDIHALDQKLTKKIEVAEQSLRGEIHGVERSLQDEIHGLKNQMNQNHSALIHNQIDVEKRMAMLEAA